MEKSHTRQPVPTAVRNVKYPSNLIQTGQFTAESVTAKEDPREDTKNIR